MRFSEDTVVIEPFDLGGAVDIHKLAVYGRVVGIILVNIENETAE